jgi:hypothetical protein
LNALLKHLPKYFQLGLLALCLFFVWDMYKDFFHSPSTTTVATDAPLTDEELARLALKPHHVAIRDKDGVKAAYVPKSGHATVTIKKDGTTVLSVKNKGTSFELGLGFIYADRLRLSADVQLLYWNRFSAHVGIGAGDYAPALVPYAAIGFRLDSIRLQNTSLILGYSARKTFVVGLRVEL